ncbi:hypothetical protein HHL22_12405 [Hymenobacter sp. RP-2-7]|uniref:Transporter n=1 Tax=Hymenobacter polaris TaxID=2682546 RepID=A0A7Y0AET7_9BACT|nr:hypothetical protein [Hymenobacter polaris]NML66006.1 hypothetical protein [Hymenobacter polaris]
MKHVFIGLATLLCGFLGLSQAARAQGSYVDDALLYSRQNPAGTARTLGLGGASASLGGDYGSMTTNPAGLGLYTKSEFTFTPGVGIGNATTSMVANAASLNSGGGQQSANSFNIASIGLVFTNRRADNDASSAWRGGSFAIGFTRLADFNYGYRYRNYTDDNHSFYQFLREPGGYPQSSVLSSGYQNTLIDIDNQYTSGTYTNLDGLAYGSFVTGQLPYTKDANGNPTSYQVSINYPRSGQIQQDGVVQSKGALSQFDLGYGGNYRDRLYIGGGVGIVSVNRTLTSTFGESQNGTENFHYDDYLKTTGTGINARLGIIVRPADAIRIGVSAQTPTYISLTDSYQTTFTSNPSYVVGQGSNVLSTTPGTYDYSVTLPFRANGGLTFLFSKYGFITGDVEYVNTAATRFNPNSNDNTSSFSDVNQTISSGYQNTVNLKVGAEGRFDIFRVRLGYARYGNPYAGGTLDRGQNYFTGGLGFRTKSFFLDAAEVYLGSSKDQYAPYSLYSAASPIASINANRATTTVTAGFLF